MVQIFNQQNEGDKNRFAEQIRGIASSIREAGQAQNQAAQFTAGNALEVAKIQASQRAVKEGRLFSASESEKDRQARSKEVTEGRKERRTEIKEKRVTEDIRRKEDRETKIEEDEKERDFKRDQLKTQRDLAKTEADRQFEQQEIRIRNENDLKNASQKLSERLADAQIPGIDAETRLKNLQIAQVEKEKISVTVQNMILAHGLETGALDESGQPVDTFFGADANRISNMVDRIVAEGIPEDPEATRAAITHLTALKRRLEETGSIADDFHDADSDNLSAYITSLRDSLRAQR